MKKYIFAIIICLINYVLIKGVHYCWNSIPIMPTDRLATMMTYLTLLLYIIEVIVLILTISTINKHMDSKEN